MGETYTISKYDDEKTFQNVIGINGLLAYNMQKTDGKLKIPDIELMLVALDKDREIVGGVKGSTFLSSIEVETLLVKEELRGQSIASQLLSEIEKEAKQAGCQLSHLSTYSFQAPSFYQKQGYAICGEIDGLPNGIKLFMLKKSL